MTSGVELPIEEVPLVQEAHPHSQKQLAGLSITATQMLESMVQSTRTHSRRSGDVANAIFDGTDAVMLSRDGDGRIRSRRSR